MDAKRKLDVRGVTVLLQRLTKEYEIARDGLAAVEAINGLDETVRMLETRKATAEQAIAALEAERERVLERTEAATVAALDDQRMRLARDKDVYQADVDRLIAERGRLTSAIAAAKSEAYGLTEANKRLKTTLQVETDALRSQYTALKAEYDALRSKVIG